MWFFIFLMCLTANFLFIKCEDNDNVTVVIAVGKNCTLLPAYTFTKDRNVTVRIQWLEKQIHINHGWWQLQGSDMYANFTESHTIKATKSIEGIWMFKFLYLKDVNGFKEPISLTTYDGQNYTTSVCSTNVTIEPSGSITIENADSYIIMAIVIAVIALIIIVAQAACIVYLKAQAKKINRHNNLSKKTEPVQNDTARYCSDPGKKVVKPTPMNEINRESIIYEAPNIELPDRLPMIQPPHPPAISTMPRTPRPDQHMRIAPQTMLAAALNSPARGPNTDHLSIPRSKQSDREMNLANRPPQPLPLRQYEENYQEVYEEMGTDDNTYEPPPIINTLPPRHNIPQKKTVIPPKPVDVQREQQKCNKHTPQSMSKPAVTPKPQRPPSSAMPTTNELEQAFRRRNNVMQVPILSIPDPSSSGANPPKQKPPPVATSTSRGPVPAIPQTVPEETYYSYSNERQDSSDEEWTYEPLKPLNSYNNNMNIYNI